MEFFSSDDLHLSRTSEHLLVVINLTFAQVEPDVLCIGQGTLPVWTGLSPQPKEGPEGEISQPEGVLHEVQERDSDDLADI